MESFVFFEKQLSNGTYNSPKSGNTLWSLLIAFLVSFVFVGCTVDKGALEKEVKKIMVETMRDKGQNLTITTLSLVHQGGNNYEGLAEGTLDGEEIQLDVYVVYDGENVKAEWQPTAAYVQEQTNKAIEESNREYERQMKEYQKQVDEYQRQAEEDLQELENQRIINEMNSYQMY